MNYKLILFVCLNLIQWSNSSTLNSKLTELFTIGPMNIFWNQVTQNSSFLEHSQVGINCKNNLQTLKTNLDQGTSWAYTFLDSTSKGISGSLEITLSNFGDFDQCLQIETSDTFTSQHCMVNLVYQNDTLKGDSSFEILNKIITNPGNEQIFYSFGLCIPSGCSEKEVKILIQESIIDYPINFRDNNFPRGANNLPVCQTAASTSWLWALDPRNMTLAQILSFLFILWMISTVTTATQVHVLEIILDKKFNIVLNEQIPSFVVPVLDLLRHFSLIRSAGELVTTQNMENRSYAPDCCKLLIVLMGILAHASIYLETILGFLTVTRINILWKFFSSFYSQPIGSAGSFDLLDITSGFIVSMITFDMIKSGKFNFVKSMISRYLRYIPTLIVLLSLDFLWPIFAPSGPLVAMVSRELLSRCGRNWWKPLLLLTNTQPMSDCCIMHTFYASIDFQLFLIGVIAVYCFTKSEKLGYIFCSIGSLIGTYLLYQNAIGIKTPVMVEASPNVHNSHRYLDLVHFATYGHIHNYFVGIVVGYHLKMGYRLYQPNRLMFVLVNGMSFGLVMIAHYLPALHNIYHLIPFEYYPHYIIISKMIYGALWALIAVSVHHYYEDLKSLGKTTMREALVEGKKSEVKKPEIVTPAKIDSNNNMITGIDFKVIEFDFSFIMKWIVKLMSDISFSAHMVNLLYLRTTFMTTKVHYSMEVTSVANRAIVAGINCMILGVLFHLYFAAPFESLRRHFFTNISSHREGKKEKKDN